MTGTGPGAFERAEEAARAIRRRCGLCPDVAVVLGSGLGGFASRLADPVVLPYGELPHWPVPRAAGHEGRLVVGRAAGRTVAALAGRVHLYEGFAPAEVVFPVRVMGRLGVTVLVLTNAAGAVNTALTPGTVMIIDDHINLQGVNPLAGPNDERFGPRHPDMSCVYSPRLRALADEAARAAGVRAAHGVYAAVAGPSYETPAEIRAYRTMGADAIGMSSVPEAIAARHMGLDVLGLSCLVNMAAGISAGPLRHEDVLDAAGRMQDAFIAVLEGVLERL